MRHAAWHRTDITRPVYRRIRGPDRTEKVVNNIRCLLDSTLVLEGEIVLTDPATHVTKSDPLPWAADRETKQFLKKGQKLPKKTTAHAGVHLHLVERREKNKYDRTNEG